jgi:hypothetical protein
MKYSSHDHFWSAVLLPWIASRKATTAAFAMPADSAANETDIHRYFMAVMILKRLRSPRCLPRPW